MAKFTIKDIRNFISTQLVDKLPCTCIYQYTPLFYSSSQMLNFVSINCHDCFTTDVSPEGWTNAYKILNAKRLNKNVCNRNVKEVATESRNDFQEIKLNHQSVKPIGWISIWPHSCIYYWMLTCLSQFYSRGVVRRQKKHRHYRIHRFLGYAAFNISCLNIIIFYAYLNPKRIIIMETYLITLRRCVENRYSITLNIFDANYSSNFPKKIWNHLLTHKII